MGQPRLACVVRRAPESARCPTRGDIYVSFKGAAEILLQRDAFGSDARRIGAGIQRGGDRDLHRASEYR
jgi:hypothetical protein